MHTVLAAALALLAQLLLAASPVPADERSDRLRGSAQKALGGPGIASPYPCDDGWSASAADNRVVDVTPWMEAGGLKRGDRFVAIGGVAVSTGGWPAALKRAPAGQPLQVVVEREGQQVRLLLSCRRSDEWWRTHRALLEAVAAGRWDDCLTEAKKLTSMAGRPFFLYLRLQVECHRERSQELRQRPPEEYWTLLHAFGSKAIEESRYRPAGLTALRPTLLAIADALEKSGRRNLAGDLKRQLGGTAPGPASPSGGKPKAATRRSGTAFAVRPDGTLLTALHVVRDAKRVEVWCPESTRVMATIVRTSEGADLAVLKLERGETPAYLGFADPRAVKIGERVFTLGFPASRVLGPDVKFTEGVISAMSGAAGDSSRLQITVPIQGGSSGGPLLNEAGEVVGVVTSTAAPLPFLKGTGALPQNVNWAVKGSLALHLFEPAEPPPPATDRAAAIERATKATCVVTASTAGD